MATRSSFQALADNLINSTFSDFRDPVELSQVDFDYDTQSDTVITSDTTKGIRLEFKKAQFDGTSVEMGDYKIVLVQQGLTVDIRADNVKMTFNGKAVQIVQVLEDAARAAYTLHVRDK